MSPEPTVVLNFGPSGGTPGGISSVIDGYRRHAFASVVATPVRTTRRPHDPLGIVFLAAAAMRLLWLRTRRPQRRLVAAVHLSQGGSFVREASIVFIARAIGVPVVGHVHGSGFTRFASTRPRLVRSVLRRCTAVVVLSDEARDVVEGFGIAAVQLSNVVEVPGSVRPMADRDLTVVFAGEVSTRKGADVLLDAWPLVAGEQPDWRLQIIGPWRLSQPTPADVPAGVDYLGVMSVSEVGERLAQARVAVLPSRAETLPMFVLEAMAAGCAVIVSMVGALPSLIADADIDLSVLVRPGQVSELVQALATLMADSDLAAKVADLGRRYCVEGPMSTAYDAVEQTWLAAAGIPRHVGSAGRN